MTGSFKEFKVENQGSNTWDEQKAVASTAVCSVDLFNFFVSIKLFSLHFWGFIPLLSL